MRRKPRTGRGAARPSQPIRAWRLPVIQSMISGRTVRISVPPP